MGGWGEMMSASHFLATFWGLGTKGGDCWHNGTIGGGIPESLWPTSTPH